MVPWSPLEPLELTLVQFAAGLGALALAAGLLLYVTLAISLLCPVVALVKGAHGSGTESNLSGATIQSSPRSAPA